MCTDLPNYTLGETEKEFSVTNIPADFVDWDLFHIFYKYGTIHNVKIPSNQTQSGNKYGFVVMGDFNGADALRSHLKNGKYLITSSGLQLKVHNVLNYGEKWFSRGDEEYCSHKNRTSSKEKKKSRAERTTASKVYEPRLVVKCFSQDLPLRTPIKVRVVESPHFWKCVDDDFVFHVIPVDQKLGEEYAVLQREMNKFCVENHNLEDPPKIGQYALFCRANVAYRAVRNSDLTMYLVDTGEIVPMKLSQLWNITYTFTLLPTLVVPCGISEIFWSRPSQAVFNNCRNALKQWSSSCVNGLTATATEYSGFVNMIHLEAISNGVVEDFAASITTKGLCMELLHTYRSYSREVLLGTRNSIKTGTSIPPIKLSEDIAEIVIGLQTLTVP